MPQDSMPIDEALAGAKERREFVLDFQPKARGDTGHLAGVEALLRWKRGEARVAPGEFIPALERSGLIIPVGAWVLSEACRQVRAWIDAGIGAIPMAVNVSSLQLRDPGYFELVRAELNGHALDPRLLEVEITESCLIDQEGCAVQELSRIRKLGVRVSLDDFGTGFSSLGLLAHLPVDAIKIDRTFVHSMTDNPESAAVTHAILDLARNLRLATVAEGVETEGQLVRLVARKCDYIQGFLYSKPLSAAEFEDFQRAGTKLEIERAACAPTTHTLLLVDDEPNILSSLRRLLRPDGYRVLTAGSGPEGLRLLAENEIDLVISDQRMPGMTGVEFLRRVKELRPEVMRIVLSGFADLQSITNAINEGAVYKFLAKPWDDDMLRSNIVEALRRKEIADENRRLGGEIQAAKEQLEASNAQLQALVAQNAAQIAHERAALDLTQEIVQKIPWPILGVDGEGLIALANASAEGVLASGRPLLGMLACESLPEPVVRWMEGEEEGYTLEQGAARYRLLRRKLTPLSGAERLLVLGQPLH